MKYKTLVVGAGGGYMGWIAGHFAGVSISDWQFYVIVIPVVIWGVILADWNTN